MRKLIIKICGITNSDDAEAAIAAGADVLGLIFVAGTPRFVSQASAKEIVKSIGGRVKTVGVFMDAEPSEIISIKQAVGFDLVQLHGQEPVEVARGLSGMDLIKAVAVADAGDLEHAAQYKGIVQYILIDRAKTAAQAPQSVGSGAACTAIDTARILKSHPPAQAYLLAGGIDPNNVAEICALLIGDPNFAGIDVASGVESAPGKKDHDKIKSLIATVKEVASHAVVR